MGTVDYRLLPAFLQSLRERGGDDCVRLVRADVDRFLARIERGPAPLRERTAPLASVHLFPTRDG